MSNTTPPRIEREAEVHVKRIENAGRRFAATFSPPVSNGEFQALWTGYEQGAYVEVLRAAPVVEALEERLAEWEVSQEMERKTVDLINSVTTSDECRVPYPDMPNWVIQYKQILETYKADV